MLQHTVLRVHANKITINPHKKIKKIIKLLPFGSDSMPYSPFSLIPVDGGHVHETHKD
jgi:hypothetical protein